ncbi:GNAT family N-acetyltransferase [Sedimentitalea todarodis]|uniref:GNAT family N-acetyltransferase n=1 Tax=Sedimentitalea todarodis TaxID=1631240 RepID=A0ABU3VIP5_9RHOB|nr:GNAT family N-acetyltransferase [Sedimentitalea todarodis]
MAPADMAEIHKAAFAQARPWSAEEFASLLDQQFCHVAGDADCFALFRVIADEAELLTIATRPKSQRQGRARACMLLWHDRARALGATQAFLDVAADNHPALALYSACGYVRSGTRTGYYPRPDGTTCDAILMSRDLSQG